MLSLRWRENNSPEHYLNYDHLAGMSNYIKNLINVITLTVLQM